MATSYLNTTLAGAPRGIRNNNPGNLRRLPKISGKDQLWNGEIPYSQSKDSSFSQFIDMPHGIRAMMRDLVGDIKKGKNTITKFISEYAPGTENNTAAYIRSVAGALGLSADTVIEPTQETVIALCKIIATVENGATWAARIPDSDYQEAINILGIDLKKKVSHLPSA